MYQIQEYYVPDRFDRGTCFFPTLTFGQSCPSVGTTTISSYPNTYFPAGQNTLNSGSTTISLGKVTYGTTPISKGDVVLVIQMQGTQIDTVNSNLYGSGAGTGNGYLNNANMLAGNMEFAVANSSVPLTGGSLSLVSP